MKMAPSRLCAPRKGMGSLLTGAAPKGGPEVWAECSRAGLPPVAGGTQGPGRSGPQFHDPMSAFFLPAGCQAHCIQYFSIFTSIRKFLQKASFIKLN